MQRIHTLTLNAREYCPPAVNPFQLRERMNNVRMVLSPLVSQAGQTSLTGIPTDQVRALLIHQQRTKTLMTFALPLLLNPGYGQGLVTLIKTENRVSQKEHHYFYGPIYI